MHCRLLKRGFFLIALVTLGALSGCATPVLGAGSSAPSPTPSPAAPAGWSIYHGDHFTIAYPGGWSYSTPQAAAEGGQSTLVVLTGPQPRDQIEVLETSGITQSHVPDYCSTTGQTQVQLAGLAMGYQVAEGVHRVWSFFTSAHIAYSLSALDADQSAAMQAQHDTILATFRPDDSTTGCP